MKQPLTQNLAALAMLCGLAIAGLIAALSFAHDAVPAILNYVDVGLFAGGLGVANPLPPPPTP